MKVFVRDHRTVVIETTDYPSRLVFVTRHGKSLVQSPDEHERGFEGSAPRTFGSLQSSSSKR